MFEELGSLKIKIIDFGSSLTVRAGSRASRRAGTPPCNINHSIFKFSWFALCFKFLPGNVKTDVFVSIHSYGHTTTVLKLPTLPSFWVERQNKELKVKQAHQKW